MLLKHVVLIMQIIVIKMDEIRQERSDQGSTLKLK